MIRPLLTLERLSMHIPNKGWAETIRKVHEVDPMVCPKCGGTMKIIAFITDCDVVDKILFHFKLTFAADRH